MNPKAIPQCGQVFLIMLDLTAEPAQRLRRTAYRRKAPDGQHGENAQLRLSQHIPVIGRLSNIVEQKIRGNALQKRLRYRCRLRRFSLVQKVPPVRL